MPAALLFAIKALGYIGQAAAAGKDIVAFASVSYDVVKKMQAEDRGPTPEETAALDAAIEADLAELNRLNDSK